MASALWGLLVWLLRLFLADLMKAAAENLARRWIQAKEAGARVRDRVRRKP